MFIFIGSSANNHFTFELFKYIKPEGLSRRF
ncbi:hypothetical protein LINPERPRIM_LOCUS19344, partial [Linum perenne]